MPRSPAAAHVFNIPASAPFLPTLIGALVEGKLIKGFPAGGDPLALAQATLYLPTRRACQLAREAFLEANGGAATMLPRIVPLGDIDEDEIVFAQAATGALASAALKLPPTIEPLERRLALAQLVSGWAGSRALHGADGTPLVANTPAAVFALADDLARLIDDMTTRGVGWDRLDKLVENPDFDKYWELSVGLLKVVRDKWPAFLAERGAIEPAARRDRLIEAEGARLKNSDAPVIVAGSTGSMPSTALLIETVARLPRGAVVLPGLDTHLEDAAWRQIAGEPSSAPHDGGTPSAGHPQFAMQALLARIGIARKDAAPLAPSGAREAIISEALRPAATTEQWQKSLRNKAFAQQLDPAFGAITLIEATNTEHEAMAAAIALREAADTPGKSVALITPDRALARRVRAALDRWNVTVEDSGGDSLADTPAGIFARLAAEAALGGLEPVTLLALLKHPLFRLGGDNRQAIATIERAVLRGPRPKPLSSGLCDALASFVENRARLHRSDPRKSITEPELAAAAVLADGLAAALAPFEALAHGMHSLDVLTRAHEAAVVALGGNPAFVGPDGTRLAGAFEDLTGAPGMAATRIAAADYPELFEQLIAGRVVRARQARGARVRILGLLEARLQTFDRVVLGSLNEGTWPPDVRSDAWLSRPMRLKLGLNLPELRIGLAAHDFTQMLGAKEVFLTRAAKVTGTPTVPARFVQRLAALAGPDRWAEVRDRGQDYLEWAQRIDAPAQVTAAPQPAPTPPLEARPMKMSVTDIEHWLRDPYTIYAKHVLRVVPVDPVDTPPGAADRGSAIHDAIGNFTKAYATAALPADAEEKLRALGKESFAHLEAYPEAKAFWWPRFLRIAEWFVTWERKRRPAVTSIFGEIRGEHVIPLGARSFTLSGIADRIELGADGYVMLDYKTGSHRTEPEVRTGLAPQLTLEGAMLRNGGFKGLAAGPIAQIVYVTLKGGDPAGQEHPVKFKEGSGSADDHSARALERLTELVRKFEDPKTPYRSLVHPKWKTHYGTYDHLARVKEWSESGSESGADE